MQILIRALGCMGIVVAFLSFQCRTHKGIMWYKSGTELLFSFQYFLLGAYTGAGLNLVGIARNLIFAHQIEKKRPVKPFVILFCGIILVYGVVSWQGILSLFIIASKLVSTAAYSMRNPFHLRLLSLPTSACWLVHNLVVDSYEGAICEAFTLLSILIALVRFDLPRLRKTKA